MSARCAARNAASRARALQSGASCNVSRTTRTARREATSPPACPPAPSLTTARDGSDVLTQREREILQLLANGDSNADVAAKLFISQETVKSHVRHILAKLEADTRTHAVAIAIRESIID